MMTSRLLSLRSFVSQETTLSAANLADARHRSATRLERKGQSNISLIGWFGSQVVLLHTFMQYRTPSYLRSQLRKFVHLRREPMEWLLIRCRRASSYFDNQSQKTKPMPLLPCCDQHCLSKRPGRATCSSWAWKIFFYANKLWEAQAPCLFDVKAKIPGCWLQKVQEANNACRLSRR